MVAKENIRNCEILKKEQCERSELYFCETCFTNGPFDICVQPAKKKTLVRSVFLYDRSAVAETADRIIDLTTGVLLFSYGIGATTVSAD